MKKRAESPIDVLPDSLLILILSFLSIKEAAVTCVLSKRWQYLWSHVPRLDLWESENENEDPRVPHRFVSLDRTRRFVAWVNSILAVRTTNSVDKFSLRIQYHRSYDSDIDNWIGHAVRNRVKKLNLLIHSRDRYEYYTLPDAIYSCSLLQCLLVQGNIVMSTHLDKIDWRCLTELYLEKVELDQQLAHDILTAGCPLLQRLELKRCFGVKEVLSQTLRIIAVEVHSEDEIPLPLQVSAPALQFLDISYYVDGGRLLELLHIQSLCKIRIDFMFLHGWHPAVAATDYEEIMSHTHTLLGHIQHVDELQLKPKCFEIISMFPLIGLRLPQSTRTRLEVSSSIAYMHNVSGIMALLESSPNLEVLVLEGFHTVEKYASLDTAAKGDLDCDLSHLKSIYIKNFSDPNGEPLLKLFRILLKRAPLLENMEVVIDCVETRDFIRIIYPQLQHYTRAFNIKADIVVKHATVVFR